MIPYTYPSSVSGTTGRVQCIVYYLPSVAGLTRWVDYIPVKQVGGTPVEGTTDANGYQAVVSIGSTTGLVPYKDYIPVYEDAAATVAWGTGSDGYIPVGASGGISLPQSANRVFHLSADSLNLSNGATITPSAWVDSVGGIPMATLGAAPTFQTNVIGGKPSVRFNGTTQYIGMNPVKPTALTNAIDSGICTVVIVCRAISAKSNGAIFSASAGGDSALWQASGTNFGRYAGGGTMMAPSTDTTNLFVIGTTSTTPYTLGSGTGLERSYLNGGCVASNVAKTPATTANFAIGAVAAGTLPANADVFEIIVWNTCLSPLEMLRVQKWVANKYSQALPWTAGNKFTVFDGDSITAGVGATNVAGTYPYKTAQSLSLPYGAWSNLGIGGFKASNMATKATTGDAYLSIPSEFGIPLKVAAFEYYNVRADGAAAIQGYINGFANTVRGTANTKLCLGTTTSSSSDPDATRTSVNSYYDTNFATYSDAYVQLHNNVNIGVSGAQAANPTYYSDVVHLSDLGYTSLAGMMTTGLTGL